MHILEKKAMSKICYLSFAQQELPGLVGRFEEASREFPWLQWRPWSWRLSPSLDLTKGRG